MTSPAPAPVPTPRFRQILGSADDIARSMGHSYVGAEHLFLAILRDPDAVPTQALAQVADTSVAERHLLAIMSSPSYRTPSTTAYRPPGDDSTSPGQGAEPR